MRSRNDRGAVHYWAGWDNVDGKNPYQVGTIAWELWGMGQSDRRATMEEEYEPKDWPTGAQLAWDDRGYVPGPGE
jgi:hypothetical protein